jgi:hypothetical protein
VSPDRFASDTPGAMITAPSSGAALVEVNFDFIGPHPYDINAKINNNFFMGYLPFFYV